MARRKRTLPIKEKAVVLPRSERHFFEKSQRIMNALDANNESNERLFGITYIEYSMGEIAHLVGQSRSSRMMRFLYCMCDASMLVLINKPATMGTGFTDQNVFFVTPKHFTNRPRTIDMFQELS